MPLTAEQIDQLRMPNPYQAPAPTGINNPFMTMLSQGRGGSMPGAQSKSAGYTPDPRGSIDPAALQALAYGTEYDVDARRNAIAARILENEAAAAAGAAKASPASGQAAVVSPGMLPIGFATMSPEQAAQYGDLNRGFMQGSFAGGA